MKREKVQGQERILAEHLDGLERNGFCDFEKPQKRACQNVRLSSTSKARREASRNNYRKGRDARQSQSVREINSRENRLTARPWFVKPIRNGLRKVQNLIECRPSMAETGLAGRENGIRLQKEK